MRWVVNQATAQQGRFDTVLFATGRRAATADLRLAAAGLHAEPGSGKIVCPRGETTRVPSIHVIGDARFGGPELTPVAARQGQLLAARLFGGATAEMDYELIPTTVFTPQEYACVGMTEEEALERLPGRVDVFHLHYATLEQSFLARSDVRGLPVETPCYAKVICHREAPRRVLGVHILGPHAGEIIQGVALAMKLGATKEAMDSLITVHPTHGEEIFRLTETKEQNRFAVKRSC